MVTEEEYKSSRIAEIMKLDKKATVDEARRLVELEVVKNNTSVNEDEQGICNYCGESHLGLTCPDSEEYTKGWDE